jgi:hypothetical protein
LRLTSSLTFQKAKTILTYLLIGLHGWLLILKLPYTIWIIFRTFRPGGLDISDNDFWAFGKVDAGFRSWYNKIARDYRKAGRFGYAWDDGLGMPLGSRIYNNYITYFILDKLGTRRMNALGLVQMLLIMMILGYYQFGIYTAVGIGVVAIGSPLIISSYTHLGKPESFWYGFGLLFIFLSFSDKSLLAGICWSIIAFVSLPFSVMLSIISGPAILLHLFQSDNLAYFLIGTIPGVIKHFFRLLYILRSGFLSHLVREQTRIWKSSWFPSTTELTWWIPLGLSIIFSSYQSHQLLVGLTLLVCAILLGWINLRIIFLNDPQSFYLTYWVVGFGFVMYTKSYIGILFIILMIYNRPDRCGIPVNPLLFKLSTPLQNSKLEYFKFQFEKFPFFSPTALPYEPDLSSFFNHIPYGCRFIFESDGDPRTESKYRYFLQWTEEFLPKKKIDLVNEIYTRLVEPELVDKYLINITGEKIDSEKIIELCHKLGVSFIIAYSENAISKLQKIGFLKTTEVELGRLDIFRKIIEMPAKKLVLFHYPAAYSIVEPSAELVRSRNKISWRAKAGETYTIKYRHHRDFTACQGNKFLPVLPFSPFDDLPLRFMKVSTPENGPVTLQFKERYI